MLLKFLNTILLASFLWLCSCSSPEAETKAPTVVAPLQKDSSIKYAKRFAIAHQNGRSWVFVFGDKARPNDTTAIYVIGSDSSGLRQLPKKAKFIKGPCQHIAALSSIYANMLFDLGAANKLVAIDNIDYVINPGLQALYTKGQLAELAKGPEIDLEKTVALHPDIVFTFGMGEPGRDVNPKLQQSGIAVAVSIDHLETSPLARAEWIKFYAAFVGKAALADSIFSATEKNYNRLQSLVKHATWAPTVFSEIKYGDAWYVPGGNSFMAQLFKDAGASYIWRNDANAGSLPLSFEQVYSQAKDADFWVNLSMVKTKTELLGYESRYSEFKAFKAGHLYNNNKVTNAKGYSTYWETGMIYPDHILSDLIHIFHPELNAGGNDSLYYYRPIQ